MSDYLIRLSHVPHQDVPESDYLIRLSHVPHQDVAESDYLIRRPWHRYSSRAARVRRLRRTAFMLISPLTRQTCSEPPAHTPAGLRSETHAPPLLHVYSSLPPPWQVHLTVAYVLYVRICCILALLTLHTLS